MADARVGESESADDLVDALRIAYEAVNTASSLVDRLEAVSRLEGVAQRYLYELVGEADALNWRQVGEVVFHQMDASGGLGRYHSRQGPRQRFGGHAVFLRARTRVALRRAEADLAASEARRRRALEFLDSSGHMGDSQGLFAPAGSPDEVLQAAIEDRDRCQATVNSLRLELESLAVEELSADSIRFDRLSARLGAVSIRAEEEAVRIAARSLKDLRDVDAFADFLRDEASPQRYVRFGYLGVPEASAALAAYQELERPSR